MAGKHARAPGHPTWTLDLDLGFHFDCHPHQLIDKSISRTKTGFDTIRVASLIQYIDMYLFETDMRKAYVLKL